MNSYYLALGCALVGGILIDIGAFGTGAILIFCGFAGASLKF